MSTQATNSVPAAEKGADQPPTRNEDDEDAFNTNEEENNGTAKNNQSSTKSTSEKDDEEVSHFVRLAAIHSMICSKHRLLLNHQHFLRTMGPPRTTS